MNKFVIALLFVAVASAFASPEDADVEEMTQLSLATTDEEEKSQLSGEKLVFDDFCVSSRDFVLADIKQTSNKLSSNVFSLFFDSAEALGRDTLELQKVGADRLSKQLTNPDAEIAEASNEAEQIIAEGQKKIQEGQSQPQSFLTAFKAIVTATSANVGRLFNERLNKIKSFANIGNVAATLQNACAKVEAYEIAMREQLASYQEEVVSAKSPALARLSLDEVPCVTSRRIIRIDGLCKFASAAKPSINKLMQTRN